MVRDSGARNRGEARMGRVRRRNIEKNESWCYKSKSLVLVADVCREKVTCSRTELTRQIRARTEGSQH